MEEFKLIVINRLQRLFHIQPDLDMLFVKLTAQIEEYIRKIPPAYYASRVGDLMAIKLGLPWRVHCAYSFRRKLGMVPCHICHIYGICSSKVVKRSFKVIIYGRFRKALQAHNGVAVFTGKESFHYVILLY